MQHLGCNFQIVNLKKLFFYPIGYINENGHLNLKRFEKYLMRLSDVSTFIIMLHSMVQSVTYEFHIVP